MHQFTLTSDATMRRRFNINCNITHRYGNNSKNKSKIGRIWHEAGIRSWGGGGSASPDRDDVADPGERIQPPLSHRIWIQ